VRLHNGTILSGASAAAAENYQQALSAYLCYAGDVPRFLGGALADSPGFTMAHVLYGYMNLVAGNADMGKAGVAASEVAVGLPATEHEQGHVAALAAMAAGGFRKAGRILEDVSLAHPNDVLALQVGSFCDFLTGESRMLRDRIGRVLPAWSKDDPDYHAVLGMLAFGLEETGQYDRAEAAGRRAIELNPRNGWAQHAVAHVLEMQDRREDGIAWMREDIPRWTEESFLQVHNWWHLSLFHLGLDEIDEVLALYDGPIWGASRSNFAFDIIDAAALLWRLKLRGVELGGRFAELADVVETEPRGQHAFADAHALMALIGAGRFKAAEAVVARQQAALKGPGDNAMFVRDVGLPLMQGLLAFGQERHGEAVEHLREVRNRAARFGGSHAQRDLIDLTLIAAAGKAGEFSLEAALFAEREAAKPTKPAGKRRLAAA
jgi:tetratricopeptide (TPR) repeat protein